VAATAASSAGVGARVATAAAPSAAGAPGRRRLEGARRDSTGGRVAGAGGAVCLQLCAAARTGAAWQLNVDRHGIAPSTRLLPAFADTLPVSWLSMGNQSRQNGPYCSRAALLRKGWAEGSRWRALHC